MTNQKIRLDVWHLKHSLAKEFGQDLFFPPIGTVWGWISYTFLERLVLTTQYEVGMRADWHYKFSCSKDFPETGTAKDQKCNEILPKSTKGKLQHPGICSVWFYIFLMYF